MSMILDGTNGAFLPTWTTATRPASPSNGEIGYNSTTGLLDQYVGGAWSSIPAGAGGVTTFSGGTTGLTPNTATSGAITLAGTLAIANGGTNSTATPTAGGVGYGTGSAHAYTGAGTSGQLLKSNGTSAPTWTCAPAGGLGGMQVFTSNGTFTIPAGKTTVKATVVGGGAGGGSVNTGTTYAGAGGGGGGTAIKYLTGLTPGNTISVTVGAGGSGGTSGGNGSSGGCSSISSGTQTISTVTGGGGLACGNGFNTGKRGGIGGVGSGGCLNFYGSGGGGASYNASGTSGHGGSSFMGGGGAGANIACNASLSRPGLSYGGGGAGAVQAGAGSNGASGVVIFEY